MDAARPHLELSRLELAAPRRRQLGGGGRRPRDNPSEHSRRLTQEIDRVSGDLQSRADLRPLGIDPRLVFMLTLGDHGSLEESDVADLGLRTLAVDGNNHMVVFPDSVALERLRQRISTYGETDGRRYKDTAAIESIRPLTRQDRTGRRLQASPMIDGELAPLDVELWHSGDQAEMGTVVDSIAATTNAVLDRYVGLSICLLRVRATAELIDRLLEFDHVKEIDRRSEPTFEMFDLVATPVEAFEIIDETTERSPSIIVVDSGILSGHPVLQPVVAGSRSFVIGDAVGAPTHGHGTRVAGIAAYGDVAKSIAARQFVARHRLVSAKVTNSENQYDPDQLIESQLRRLVEDLTTEYPSSRVVNISLGDSSATYSDGGLQLRLAAVVDELAFEFRDREIVFTISAGNHDVATDGEAALLTYPQLLLEPSHRIVDPAGAMLALTVGGLSGGEGRPLDLGLERVDRGVAERDWPSAFTRTGLGHDGALKPDLVEYAGDARFAMGELRRQPQASGIPTTSDEFGAGSGELFRTVAGTSFAAPMVAYQAARLADEFPEASSNLIRALLANCARVPADRPPGLDQLSEHHVDILRTYGHGKPNLEEALASESNRVVLLADDSMPLDHVYLYEIPELPAEFRAARGSGFISVSLAYDPPSRHTRSREYLGVRMQFSLFRNANPQDVFDAIREWSSTEQAEFDDDIPGRRGLQTVDLRPGPKFRLHGTLQRGVARVSSPTWQYDGAPLILAAICQRRWAPADLERQRFAVVVSVRHENDQVDLYSTLSARARAYQQVRVRIGE